MSPSLNGQKIILLYGEDPALLDRVRTVFKHYEVINPQSTLEVFDFMKDNFVEAILFSTFQTEPAQGLSDTDLDILLYTASSEESQNKRMVFLPLDNINDNANNDHHAPLSPQNKAQDYYKELYKKYLFLLSPATKETLSEASLAFSQSMKKLNSLVSLLDCAINDLDKRVLSCDQQEDDSWQRIAGGEGDDNNTAQLVKGSGPEEDNFSQTIAGEAEDLAEGTIKIRGSKEVIKEENFIVKGGHEEGRDQHFSMNSKNINSRNAHGMTPLMVYAKLGKVEEVQKLLTLGADPALLSHQGKTLLHYACRGTNDLDLIEDLVENHGLKVNKRDNQGHDPLYEATVGNNNKLLDYLIYSGARLEAKYDGETLLHIAIKKNALKSFSQLLESGANLKGRNHLGEDIVTFCKKKRLLKPLRIIADFTKKKKGTQAA